MPHVPPPIQLAKAQPTVQPCIFTLPSSPNSQAQPCSLPSSVTTGSAIGFRARDVGFFDPDSDKATEIKNGCRLYHNVHSFTQKIRAMDSLKLRHNLEMCLLGKADIWFTQELSHTSRLKLKDGIQLWCEALESRFGESFRAQPAPLTS